MFDGRRLITARLVIATQLEVHGKGLPARISGTAETFIILLDANRCCQREGGIRANKRAAITSYRRRRAAARRPTRSAPKRSGRRGNCCVPPSAKESRAPWRYAFPASDASPALRDLARSNRLPPWRPARRSVQQIGRILFSIRPRWRERYSAASFPPRAPGSAVFRRVFCGVRNRSKNSHATRFARPSAEGGPHDAPPIPRRGLRHKPRDSHARLFHRAARSMCVATW